LARMENDVEVQAARLMSARVQLQALGGSQ